MHTPASRVRYSVVVPIFNEEAALPVLLRRLAALLDEMSEPAEVIFVDDGSTDCSSIVLEGKARLDRRFRYLGLSRNFGHQIAITAGIEAASGDAVIVMDADLQDPPEVVLQMIARWKDGYDVVNARRLTRAGETPFKRWTAQLFYRLLRRFSSVEIPKDVGDFRLMDRKVVEAFRGMPERERFVRGMVAWLGFRQTEVEFHREARIAGETKYPFRKMMRLASNGVLAFSDVPLRLAMWLGFAVSGFAVMYGLYAIWLKLFTNNTVTGWSSIVVIVSLLCGINMLLTGIVGLYVGRIHTEVKHRPLYIVGKRTGFDRPSSSEEGKPAPDEQTFQRRA